MKDTTIVRFVTAAERTFGRSEKTARILQESEETNQKSRRMVSDIACSTDEILEQTAFRSHLLAEQMRNDNLRQMKAIEKERRSILGS